MTVKVRARLAHIQSNKFYTQGKLIQLYNTVIIITRTKNHFNKMKKEVGMLLQKRADTRAVGIYKLYEENTH